jgi:hypothetical protein
MALWSGHPPSRLYARELAERGKGRGVIACALGHRPNGIAFAMMRSQRAFDPSRWK